MMHLMRRVLRGGTIAVALAAALSCDKATGPTGQAGVLTLTLATPNSNDGALMLTVTGTPGQIDSVTAAPGSAYEVLSSAGSPRIVIVRGALANGPIALVWVADVTRTYEATVHQAAARDTYAQRVKTGYALTLSQP